MTVSSLTFTCDMCGKKEVIDSMEDDGDLSHYDILTIRTQYNRQLARYELCGSCVREINEFINMYPLNLESM